MCLCQPASIWQRLESLVRSLSVVLTQTHHNTLSLAVRFWRCPKSRHSGITAAASTGSVPVHRSALPLQIAPFSPAAPQAKNGEAWGRGNFLHHLLQSFSLKLCVENGADLEYDSKTIQLIPS